MTGGLSTPGILKCRFHTIMAQWYPSIWTLPVDPSRWKSKIFYARLETGEYLRSSEISEEQNYDMIDGRKNNGYKAPSATNSMPPKKKPKGRQSVLAKLHKKQAEIAQRSGKKEHQQTAENDMERERK